MVDPRILRLGWAVFSVFVVVSLCFGAAALPAVFFLEWHLDWELEPHWIRIWILAMAFLPTYAIFALVFMATSALSMQLLGWRPRADMEMRLEDFEWPLLDWGRYTISMHLVRVFAGTFFRTTPVWTWYMRLNGAKLGTGVFINSLDVTDHCLLDFGDHVVVGAGVHLSGHTVERGIVKTARVTLGDRVTIGVGANIEIGVRAGDRCQIGALSAVPKFRELEADATYVGIPAKRLDEPPQGSETASC